MRDSLLKAGGKIRQVLPSTSGGVAQRWMRIHSAPRQPQAQRTVDKHLRQQSEQEGNAWKK